uniref:Protein Vpu n=1 Tax=Human immunodeficiency virus type 1 TaxID=11676 RepID=F1K3L3_HV1|nr:vpu protein [Human immunodeficiency virus 1]ADZ33376.1 vpu protein [Human immunodeficiency virus 1]ADZ33409.1 vpu protein [Human immunodeficiency virus 1]ADZ33415.1 vpu protein [Human immunodeficiency virus 1]ADZ33421.1 vpu protein [Human immunodeficiency virus 1]
MLSIQIVAIVGLVVAVVAAIVVWTLIYIEYKKIVRQRKLDRLIDRIRERAEDSGNESDGDQEELLQMGHPEMGLDAPWNVDDL